MQELRVHTDIQIIVDSMTLKSIKQHLYKGFLTIPINFIFIIFNHFLSTIAFCENKIS